MFTTHITRVGCIEKNTQGPRVQLLSSNTSNSEGNKFAVFHILEGCLVTIIAGDKCPYLICSLFFPWIKFCAACFDSHTKQLRSQFTVLLCNLKETPSELCWCSEPHPPGTPSSLYQLWPNCHYSDLLWSPFPFSIYPVSFSLSCPTLSLSLSLPLSYPLSRVCSCWGRSALHCLFSVTSFPGVLLVCSVRMCVPPCVLRVF